MDLDLSPEGRREKKGEPEAKTDVIGMHLGSPLTKRDMATGSTASNFPSWVTSATRNYAPRNIRRIHPRESSLKVGTADCLPATKSSCKRVTFHEEPALRTINTFLLPTAPFDFLLIAFSSLGNILFLDDNLDRVNFLISKICAPVGCSRYKNQ